MQSCSSESENTAGGSEKDMIKVICDSCGYKIDEQPLRPVYEVRVQSSRMFRERSSLLVIGGVEVNRYCICGKCLTKFYDHIANFFNANMEDTQ